MNTMEITKFVGAICGALLVFLLINLVSNGIFDTHSEMVAYTVEVPDESAGDAAEADAAPVDVAALVAAADPAAGEKIFKKCAACHKVGEDAKNATGPMLNGILGRAAGTVEGFKYSKAMADAGAGGLVWSDENLHAYLSDPKGFVKRNKMSFAGLKSKDDIDAYYETHDLPPHPLIAQGYPSIGCWPCTHPAAAGDDIRAGRWRGAAKTECGIHGLTRI